MRNLILGFVRSSLLGITIVLLSIRETGFVSYANASPVLQQSHHSDGTGSGFGTSSGGVPELTENTIIEWFKIQSGGEVPLSISGSRGYTNASFVGDMLSAMQAKAKMATSGPTYASTTGQGAPTVRMKRGVIAGMKRKPSERTRVIFKRTPKRGRLFSLAEIVLKASPAGDTDTVGKEEIVAKVVSKKGHSRVKATLVKGYLIFNISSLVDGATRRVRMQHVTSGKSRASKKTNSSGKTRSRIPISQANEPLLVTYENLHENPLMQISNNGRPSRDVKDVVERWETLQRDNRHPRGINCRRHDWTLDMSLFNYDWYLHPMSFNAGFCKGYCPIPLLSRHLNITNYSFMKHLFHAYTANSVSSVPRACCSPIEYESESIYYLNTNMEDVIQVFQNMKVTRCGCR